MLTNILNILRKQDVMKEVESKIKEMLDLSHSLYVASSGALLERYPVDFDLYAKDRKINLLVVEVRRKVVEHLSISEPHMVGGELVYLKVITDIERIGDYSKNILDLSKLLTKPLPDTRYLRKFRELYPMVDEFFPMAEKALFQDDQEAANQVLEDHMVVNETCEGITAELLRDAQVCGEEGIALALTARYFKRVSSHLKNVASSAVNPYSQIGYFKRPEVPEDNK
ncbi:MAG: hypothetical protein GXP49_07060 [Deltaproteobacteria bacterium]|nr:hypothetical protein [Deltaproteobacteria bacterium]